MGDKVGPGSARIVRLGRGTANLSEQVPVCTRCGHKDIMDAMALFGLFGASPPPKEWRYLLSAARRLDTAHRQFERLREGLDILADTDGDMARRRLWPVVVGDAELAIISLGRAVQMAEELRGEFRVTTKLPQETQARQKAIRKLRHAYEHIDERALDRTDEKDGSDPLATFAFLSLFKDRRLTYGNWSLGIDAEADSVLATTRSFLLRVWGELNARLGTTA